MEDNLTAMLADQARHRREYLIRSVLDALRGTVQLQVMRSEDERDTNDIRVMFTNDSCAVVAPLVEAVEILEDIIFASDGCRGHRDCVHSMEPWERARKLLRAKWEASADGHQWLRQDGDWQ